MPTTAQPTSPLAQRIVRGIQRFVAGSPIVVGADLAIDAKSTDVAKTTLGDDPALLRMLKAQRIHRVLFGADRDTSRKARYVQHREMYDRGPELKRCLQIIIDFVFGGQTGASVGDHETFEIVFGEGVSDAVRNEVDRIRRELRLPIIVPQMLQQGLLYGDSFLELVMSLTKIVKAVPHSPWNVEVNWDVFKSLLGYQIKTDSAGMGSTQGKTLHPIQMVHYAPDRELGHRYGQSIYAAGRGNHRMYMAVISATAIGVLLQGANRTNVTYQVPKGWASSRVKKFIANLKLWNGDAYFFDSDGDVEKNITQLLDFDDRIYPYRSGMDKPSFDHENALKHTENIAVAAFLQDREFINAGVPKALAGLLKDANSRAALETQGMHFVKSLRFRQQDAAFLALEIIVRALLVARIDFGADDVSIRMPMISEFNEKLLAEVHKLQAEAAKLLAFDMGVDLRWVFVHILKVPAHEVPDLLMAMAQGQAADDNTREVPPESAAETLRNHADLKESIERLSEDVKLLMPVTAKIEELLSRAA